MKDNRLLEELGGIFGFALLIYLFVIYIKVIYLAVKYTCKAIRWIAIKIKCGFTTIIDSINWYW